MNLNTSFPFFQKNAQKVPQKVPQRIPPSPWGVNQKRISRLPTGSRGLSMPNLVEIHPVVWAPKPNKQTDRVLK